MCGITAHLALTNRHDNPQSVNHQPSNLHDGRTGDTEMRNGQPSKHVVGSLRDQVDHSLDTIRHRGPDSHGCWISDDGRVGKALGSCRLQINDLTPSGNQPFENADGTIHVVVNGELYDYQQIREDIAHKTGYSFKGTSDCEIVVALYEYYGVACLSHLRGEFSLCLYDSKKQMFLASRDRSGVKPLFWTVVDNRLLIASEAKAFLPYGWKPQWDVESLMNRDWLTEERTIFKGVRKVRPGHCMICLGFDQFKERQYWDHTYPDKNRVEPRSVQEMVEGVRSKLLEAVRVRLQADVPVGIHLSGGIDSSVIAGMAKHLLDTNQIQLGGQGTIQKLQCLGVAFDKGSGFDESDLAQRTSDWLGVDFQMVEMNESKLAANFEDAVWYDEQTHIDLAFVGKHMLSKLTRDTGLKTVLSGQGSDEIFGGYPLIQADYLREQDHSLPIAAPPEQWRADAEKNVAEPAPAAWAGMPFDADYLDIGRAPYSMNEAPNWFKPLRILFSPVDFAPWTQSLGQRPTAVTLMEDISESVRQLMRHMWHPLHSAFYVWHKTVLPNMLLTTLSDRTEMSHSVEGRVPFLDHPLMEYVNHLPPSVKIRYDPTSGTLTEKWILREASKPFITQEIYERKKHPYTAPVKYPIGGPIHQLMTRLITKETIDELGFIDWSKTQDLVQKSFEEQEPNLLRKVFTLAQYVVLGQRFGVKTARP
ncbi:MAG: hypothetical protein Q9186_004172 [Xanthomendoza sp. 1 TL-2023]